MDPPRKQNQQVYVVSDKTHMRACAHTHIHTHTHTLSLTSSDKGVPALSEDLHEVVGEIPTSQIQTHDGMG